MEVVAGTYSNLIYGHFVKPNEEQKLKFSTSFTNVAHSGIVKCMAVCKKGYLASGSSDEKIQIFKLKGKRIVLEPFREHEEPVVSLKFHKSSHLFSASSDGRIIIWKTGSWQKLKVLKYKKPVLDFAVHPSGYSLLSTCKDKTLQTWDLTTARRKFTINLKEEGEIIEFSPDGLYFIIVSGSKVDVYLTKSKILLVGGSGGKLAFYSIKSGEKIHEMSTNTARVKSMSVCGSKVVIASSDGYLKLYDVSVQNSEITVTFITGVVRHQRWQCVCMIDLEDTENNVNKSGFAESKTDEKKKDKKADDSNKDDDGDEDTDNEEEEQSGSDDEEDDSDDDDEDNNGDSEDESSEGDDDQENGSNNSEDGDSESDEEDEEKMEE